jgi:hypothetical protein
VLLGNIIGAIRGKHYYKMGVKFISPHSLDQWIHYFFIGPRSLQLVNSLKIQWNHLMYNNTFCCSERTFSSLLFLWVIFVMIISLCTFLDPWLFLSFGVRGVVLDLKALNLAISFLNKLGFLFSKFVSLLGVH